MKVADILKVKGESVVTVSLDSTIREIARLLTQRRIGAVLVLDGHGEPVGIVSERDLVRAIATHGELALLMPARVVMTRGVRVCRPSDSIKDVMTVMTTERIRHLPVVAAGRLRGLVSIGDVVKHRLQEMETEQNVLRDCLLVSR